MKILVALKQVPDTETKIKVGADGRSLDATDVKWITGPYDEYALEEAIRIKEAGGGEVVAISAGADSAREVLRNALALGADAALHGHRELRLRPLGHGPRARRVGGGRRAGRA